MGKGQALVHSTVGVMINTYTEKKKVQRADSQFIMSSLQLFMIAYLQEAYAWTEAGNAFVDVEIVMEGDHEDDVIDEDNPCVKAMRVRILVKTEQKKAMNFLTRPKSFHKSI